MHRGDTRSEAMLVCLLMCAQLPLGACRPGETEAVDWAQSGDSLKRRVVVDDRRICTTCVRLVELVVLGDSIGDGFIQPSRVVTQDSLLRFWVAQGESVKVFDHEGRFLREVGRAGEGPSEFAAVTFAHTDERGRVHILDSSNLRESVFDERLNLLDDARLPAIGFMYNVAALADGYVVNAWAATADMIGLPLHIVRDGQVIRSFGATEATGPLDAFRSIRILATDGAGTIASAQRFAYSVEVWNASGDRLYEFRHERALNRHEVRQALYNVTDNPIPHEIRAIRLDEVGRLWVLLRLMRDGWERHFEPRVYADGQVGLQRRADVARDSVYVSRLDVVSLQSGTVMARQELPGLFDAFVGDDLLLEQRFLQHDEPQIVVWQAGILNR